MYQVIRARKTTRELYADALVAEGVLSADAAKAMAEAYRDKLDAGEVTADVVTVKRDEFVPDWNGLLKGKLDDVIDTTVPRKKLDVSAFWGKAPGLKLAPREDFDERPSTIAAREAARKAREAE